MYFNMCYFIMTPKVFTLHLLVPIHVLVIGKLFSIHKDYTLYISRKNTIVYKLIQHICIINYSPVLYNYVNNKHVDTYVYSDSRSKYWVNICILL